MTSRQLRFARYAASLLAMGSGIALYGSYFAVWQTLSPTLRIMPVFWRLAAIDLTGWGAMPLLVSASGRHSERAFWPVLTVLLGVMMSVFLLVLAGPEPGFHWLLGIALGLGAWLRGLWTGSATVNGAEYSHHLVVGVISLSTCFVYAASTNALKASLPMLMAFCGFWCTSIVLALILENLVRLSRQARSAHPGIVRYWPPLFIGLALVCFWASAALSTIIPFVLGLLRTPFVLVLRVFRAAVLVFGFLAGVMIQGLFRVLSRLGRNEPPEPIDLSEPFARWPDPREIRPNPGFAAGMAWLAGAALVVTAVAVVAYLLWRRWAPQKAESIDEERETYATLGVFFDWARGQKTLLKRSFEGLGRRLNAAFDRRPATATEVYNSVLDEAKKRGCLRPPYITPHRFHARLNECFDRSQRHLHLVLSAFTSEYYAEKQISEEERAPLIKAYESIINAPKSDRLPR